MCSVTFSISQQLENDYRIPVDYLYLERYRKRKRGEIDNSYMIDYVI